MMIVIVGMITILVGMLGYAFIPEKRFEQNEKYLSSVINFYMVVCFTIFLHVFSYFFQLKYFFMDLFYVFALAIASIYLFWSIIGFEGKFEKFDLLKLRNAAIYGSIVWLMGNELASLQPQPFLIPGLLALPLLFMLVYALLVMKEMKLFFFYENPTIFSHSFLAILLAGIAVVSIIKAPQARIPIESIAAFMSLFVIYRMFRAAKPFLG